MQTDYFAADRVIFSPHVVEYQSVESFIEDCLASDDFKQAFPHAATADDVKNLIEQPTGHKPNGFIVYAKD